jgi:hypothetical protein
VNSSELKKLGRETFHFKCEDGSQRNLDDSCSSIADERHSRACKAFWEHCNAELDVEFAVGAQVLMAPECSSVRLRAMGVHARRGKRVCEMSNPALPPQIMLIYNLDRCDVPAELRLVNGSRGVVKELVTLEVCMRELEEEDRKARDATISSPGGGYKMQMRVQGESSTSVAMSRSLVLRQYVDPLPVPYFCNTFGTGTSMYSKPRGKTPMRLSFRASRS